MGEGVLAQLSPPGKATERSKFSDRGTQGTCVDAAIASNSFYSAAVRRSGVRHQNIVRMNYFGTLCLIYSCNKPHRPASAGAAGGHHKAPGWGGLSSRPKKARICRQSSSFARRQLSRGPPRRGCRTAEVRLPRSSVTAGLRALAPPPKPSTASGRASAVQRSVLNSAVQASLE